MSVTIEGDGGGFVPLSMNSLVFQALPAPADSFRSEHFPCPTQLLLQQGSEFQRRASKLEALSNSVSKGDLSEIKLFVELTWQVKVFRFCYCYPELLLQENEVCDMWNVFKDFIDVDGLMLKGTRGGKGGQKKRLSKKDKRQNVIRKFFHVIRDQRSYRIEIHVYRLRLLQNGIFPTETGQHVSHLCDIWACLDHILWEDDFINTKIRKCHDKCSCEPYQCDCVCSCGLAKPCIFPSPHVEFFDESPRETPMKKRKVEEQVEISSP
jgi:hypothetical protein